MKAKGKEKQDLDIAVSLAPHSGPLPEQRVIIPNVNSGQ